VFFSLRAKVALLSILLLAGGIGSASLLLLSRWEETLEDEIRQRGLSLVRSLARDSGDLAFAGNRTALKRLLEGRTREPGVLGAWALDLEGGALEGTGDEPGTPRVRMTRDQVVATAADDGRLLVAARMVSAEIEIGEVQLEMDLEDLIAPALWRARRDMLSATGALLAVGVLFAFFVGSGTTGGLRRLRAAMSAFSAGEFPAPLQSSSHDEVGELTDAFNLIGERLSQKEQVEAAFRRYVSDQVLRELLEHPEGIPVEGELREVTLMVVDVRDFTRLSEGEPPSRVVSFLNQALELITSEILDQGGTIDKYVGDSVFAYFGAPIASEDHVERAVASGIAIQRSVEERNEKPDVDGEERLPLRVGIAIHTGSVVIGNIGTNRKMDYTVIGDAVNVAHRLEHLAGRGTILVSEPVAKRIGGRVRLQAQGSRRVPGRKKKVTIYRVLYGDP
jgi:adenylate cyclase